MPDSLEERRHASDGWVDLHIHILPGMDDGAKDLSQSLEMARIAQNDGIGYLVATPHFGPRAPGVAGAPIRQAIEDVSQAFVDAGLSVTLLPGAEVQINPDVCQQVASREAITLAGSRYLLLELPFDGYPLYTEDVIFELQLMGLSVILAHPERSLHTLEHPELVSTLVERGVLMQLTAASILGGIGPRVQAMAEYLLRNNLAHIIASDAHGGQFRRPVLSDAVAAASHIVGAERAEEMVSAIPQAIINDEAIEPERPVPRRESKHFWNLLSRGNG